MSDSKKEMREIVKEVHKRAVKKFARRKILSFNVNDVWAMDLAQMPEIRGYNYIMVVIDVFSRFAMCIALKTKAKGEVNNAFKRIVAKYGKPIYLITDMGTEFINKTMKKYLSDEHINLFHIYGESKASNAERLIRTIKGKLTVKMEEEGDNDWVKYLPDVVKGYNTTVHSAIKMTPRDAKRPENADKIRPDPEEALEEPKFKLGDKVRISVTKGKFEKGYTANWSYEVFTITGIRYTNPITYNLTDLKGEPVEGSFYTQELQKTKHGNVFLVEKILKTRIRNGKKEALVKWKGFPDGRATWEPAENVNL